MTTTAEPFDRTRTSLDVVDATEPLKLWLSTHLATAEHEGREINFAIAGLTLVVTVAADDDHPWTQVSVDLNPLFQEIAEDAVDLASVKASNVAHELAKTVRKVHGS